VADEPTSGWEPDGQQRAALSVAQRAEYRLSYKEIAEKSGLGLSTLMGWFKVRAFAKWWQAQADGFFARKMPEIYAATFDRATGKGKKKGDHRDAKLMLERFDKSYVPRSAQAMVSKIGPADADTLAQLDRFLDEIGPVAVDDESPGQDDD